ncbi:MAG TPA: hypothetical protein VHB79_05435 [Polyangiaceae bacterium]|nr:hypothetical protein [Polyangiaceae bacterium]
METVSLLDNEADQIARAEQALESSRVELARRVQVARGNGARLLQNHRAELKPVVIGAAVLVGVGLVAAGAKALRARRRGSWLAPPRSSSPFVVAAKAVGTWALRAALRGVARELLNQAAARAEASGARAQ